MFMRGGEGSVARFGPGFFSKPNTMADFSFFFNIRLSILCKNLFFQICLRDSFLTPTPTPNNNNKKKGGP